MSDALDWDNDGNKSHNLLADLQSRTSALAKELGLEGLDPPEPRREPLTALPIGIGRVAVKKKKKGRRRAGTVDLDRPDVIEDGNLQTIREVSPNASSPNAQPPSLPF